MFPKVATNISKSPTKKNKRVSKDKEDDFALFTYDSENDVNSQSIISEEDSAFNDEEKKNKDKILFADSSIVNTAVLDGDDLVKLKGIKSNHKTLSKIIRTKS